MINTIRFRAVSRTTAVLIACAWLTACELDVTNPNAATEEGVLTTQAGLRAVAIGMQGRLGNALEEGIVIPGLISGELGNTNATQSTTREFQRFPTASANAQIEETNVELLDLWAKYYQAVKSANDILDNIDNVGFTPDTKSGMTALAKLHKAIAFGSLIEAFQQLPIQNVESPPFADRAAVLAEVLSLLASARSDLTATAPSADFNNTILAPGFDLLNTIRAMQARYSLAAGQNAQALTFANEVPVTASSVVAFTTLDQNPLSNWLHSALFFGAISSFRTNAEAGDARVDLYTTTTPLSAFGGASLVETNIYHSVTDPIPLFTQDELTLIRAEALARQNQLLLAIDEINIVRARAGLPGKTILDLPTQQAVLDEIYLQRTYSLFATGLHWADQRRLGYISEAKVAYLPYPFSERATNPNTPPDP